MKIFWDTNLFIYLWEKRSHAPEMKKLTEFVETGGHTLATSTLTLAEILVHPIRSGRRDLVEQYRQAMHRLDLIDFDRDAAVIFARLRASHPQFRPPDAIQLACATASQCELFLTNDTRLSGLSSLGSLKIQSLNEWSLENRN